MTDTVIVGTGLRLTCAREELAHKLSVVGRGVSTRTAVQILSGILIRAGEGGVILAATDMELSVRTPLEAEVAGEGAVVAPGRLLADLSRLLPAGEVVIEQRPEESLLAITCGSAEYQLNTYDAADFPRLPEVDLTPVHAVDAETLLDTLGRVGRAVSRDESRPVLTGILVRFEPGRLVMAATDSYRLAVKETAIESDMPELEAIVPARALDELRRIAAGAGRIDLGVHENQVVFGVDGTWLTTRRIDGQFPDYKKLVPEKFDHEVRLPREEVLEVVRRVGVMVQRNSPLRMSFGEGELTVSAQTQDVGEARESLPVAFAGEPLEIGFNAEFVRDGLESAEGDEVVLRLINPLRPGLITGVEDDFSYLIMPIRLAG